MKHCRCCLYQSDNFESPNFNTLLIFNSFQKFIKKIYILTGFCLWIDKTINTWQGQGCDIVQKLSAFTVIHSRKHLSIFKSTAFQITNNVFPCNIFRSEERRVGKEWWNQCECERHQAREQR